MMVLVLLSPTAGAGTNNTLVAAPVAIFVLVCVTVLVVLQRCYPVVICVLMYASLMGW